MMTLRTVPQQLEPDRDFRDCGNCGWWQGRIQPKELNSGWCMRHREQTRARDYCGDHEPQRKEK
jgi:hypothetical protein